jgi:hypothetical protein
MQTRHIYPIFTFSTSTAESEFLQIVQPEEDRARPESVLSAKLYDRRGMEETSPEIGRIDRTLSKLMREDSSLVRTLFVHC